MKGAKEVVVPKKTVYIKEADLPLWQQAENLAQDDSVSSVLTAALQQYLEGQRSLTATIRLRDGSDVVRTSVRPVSGGWLLGVAAGRGGDQVVGALRAAGIWPDRYAVPSVSPSEQLWVWVPADAIAALWVSTPKTAGGLDFHDLARQAWPLLRARARASDTVSYSKLGEELGGLHPYHQVPQVLSVIEQWCLEHGAPDLTGVVVSQRTGMPGEDYWRQNGWAELSVAQRVDRWREAQKALAGYPWPESAPF
jgi:hypothetical protein